MKHLFICDKSIGFSGERSCYCLKNHHTMMGKNLIKSKMLGQILQKYTQKYPTMESFKKFNSTKLEYFRANKQLPRRTLYRFLW